jgi:hypothetical protein
MTDPTPIRPTGPGVLSIMHAVRRAQLGSATVKAVALALATYADGNGGSIYPAVSDLEADTALSERAVRSALRSLRDAGVLAVVTPATATKATVYRLCLDRLEELARPPRAARAPPRHPSRGARDAPLDHRQGCM